MSDEEKEILNHLAYNDVINGEEPSYPDNRYYMDAYFIFEEAEKI